MTHIEAEPIGITVELDKTALMVIDMQNDFLRRGGYGQALGNDPDVLGKIIPPIQSMVGIARQRRMHIIYTREGHFPDLSDCPPTKLHRWPVGRRIGDLGPMGRILIRGEEGHAIIEELEPWHRDIIIDKPGKNAFYKTNLEEYLRRLGIVNILLTGVTTDICCSSTVSGANDRGFNAIVLGDCMASYDPARHEAALNIIKAQGGILGFVTDSQKVIIALSKI